jgi:hypothetical protein
VQDELGAGLVAGATRAVTSATCAATGATRPACVNDTRCVGARTGAVRADAVAARLACLAAGEIGVPGTGATATTGVAESRIALEILAANAPLPPSVMAPDGAEPPPRLAHRSTASTGISATSRSRMEARARFRSWRTAPSLASRSAPIST